MSSQHKKFSLRPTIVMLHRWAGLTMAGFLIVAGLTGAVISWDHELDEWLNPELWRASQGAPLSAFELARRVEADDPRALVTYLPLHAKPGEALSILVDARVDPATRQLYNLGYDQVFVDPITGQILGRREWGEIGIDRRHLVPFLYKLHYSLCAPPFLNFDRWGEVLMGSIALLWMADCFFGLFLTLPPGARGRDASASGVWVRRWEKAWRIKLPSAPYRLNFDLHRASGLWLWALLFLLALTGASLNLSKEVAEPVVNFFSSITPSPVDIREERPINEPIMPRLGLADIASRAEAEAERRGWEEPAGAVGYRQQHGIYSVYFFRPGDDHGVAGVGPAELFLDHEEGRVLGDRLPWRGTAGDLFLQVQFPLHSGRIAGFFGRVLISAMGLAVAALAVTGVVIWLQKRNARRKKTATARAAWPRDNNIIAVSDSSALRKQSHTQYKT
ncbi:PepSY-associated TM helix domain protein [Methylocella silvestris BL2]|uniref:PepSY-associated TM helix domain protein n=2 Tax=Methylocella silvestris TaxID=199596 RepID=B8EQL0_METSB|nr:PepSY-associated TM helix domain protein [Methylocella silvestris BL2]